MSDNLDAPERYHELQLAKELRQTAGDAGNGLDRESRLALDEAADRMDADYATIARIWKALGISTYEDAGGKEISEIVAEKVAAASAPASMTELCDVIYDAGNDGTAGVAEAILRKFEVRRKRASQVPEYERG